MMRRLLVVAVVALGVAAPGCERAESEIEPMPLPMDRPAPATAPAPPPGSSGIVVESDFLRDLRQRGEGGDVKAMLTLARAYEARGSAADRIEARRWYEKALAAGDESAKAALANLDRADAMADRLANAPPPPPVPPTPPATPATPAVPDALSAEPGHLPAGARGSTQPATTKRANLDPSKVTWQEVVDSYNSTDFATVAKPNHQGSFAGLSTAEDQTMIVGAVGPTENELRNVQILIRIRSRQQPAESQRVREAAAICMTVTRDNVSSAEVLGWVKNYLATEQASEPIYRNGWQITFTGPGAEGKEDRKNYLGNAVKIVMNR